MSPTAPAERQVTRTVRTFAAASFLHDIGADMIFSVWPLFLTNVLGADMRIVGLIDGLGDAVVSVSQAVSGYFSDRIGKRKPFVWMGYFFGAVARFGYALAPTWHYILPLRVLDRTGKLRGAPRDAMLSDISTRANRGRHFGFLRAMDNAGAVIGILLSMLLLKYIGYRQLFLYAAIPSLLATILVILAVRETAPVRDGLFHRMRMADLTPELRRFTVSSALLSLGSFSYSFLLIFAYQTGFENGAVPALYLLFTMIAAFASSPLGRLADRIGRKPVLMLSLALWAGMLLLFILAPSPLGVVLGFVLYGLHQAANDTVQKAFVAELAPAHHTASALGGFQMIIGLCSLPASLIAGFAWDTIGTTAPFILSLVLALVSAAVLLTVREQKA